MLERMQRYMSDFCLVFISWHQTPDKYRCIRSSIVRLGFYAEIHITFGTGWRFRLFLGQCGDSDYFWDSVEIQITFGTVWRFRLFLGQCGDSDYVWDSETRDLQRAVRLRPG